MILIGNLCIVFIFPFPNGRCIYLVHSVFPPVLDIGYFGWDQICHLSIDMKPLGATLRLGQDDLIISRSWAQCLVHLGHMALDSLPV